MYCFTNSQISTALNLLYRARYLATIMCDDNHPDIALLDLGEAHEKTQESSECLRHLTQQAVVLQKKMNDIYSNGKLTTGLPPIHIQPPSMGSVLDMLNAINGIIFVQISSKEIANLKNEIEKRQKEDGAAGESSVAQANQEEVDRLLTETMVKTAAGIPFEEQEKYGQWRQPLMKPAENLTAF